MASLQQETLAYAATRRAFSIRGVNWICSTVLGIDSELMNCLKDTVLKNDTVKGAEFPVFKPDVCTINCTGNVTRIEVIPRWCCL